MAYEDRLRQAAYRSPSGATFTLQFDQVDRSGSKKAAVHEFPQQDVADVQDLGNTAERFPMSVYFTGDEYDQAADSFWAALSERGPGALQHPRYGDIPVLPLSWSQTEKFVDGVGRADFKVDFIRVQTQVVFPVTAVAEAEAVGSATTAALAASSEASAAEFEPANAADKAAVKEQVLDGLQDYKDAFASVMAASEAIQAEANRIIGEITSTIDELLESPTMLFTSLSNLAALPAQVVTNVTAKVGAYASQIGAAVASVPGSYAQAVTAVQSFLGFLGGSAVASTIGDIRTRGEAIHAAETLDQIAVQVTQAIEAAEGAVAGYQADQEILASLTDAMSTARASLLERAFSLKAERRLTLATERTPLDLMAELGVELETGLDAALDDFIQINDLQGDEILLIPAGREVVYYA